MPRLVVYHSPCPLPARLAAAIHLGRLPRSSAWGEGCKLLRGAGVVPADLLRPATGLCYEGTDASGARVYSLGCGAAPWVVENSCRDVARLAGVSLASLRLLAVVTRPALFAEVLPLVYGLLPRVLQAYLLGALTKRGWRAAAQIAGPERSPAATPDPPLSDRCQRLPPATVYHCFAGAHTSITAANIYLGRLPAHRRAYLWEILAQPHFDRSGHREIGHLIPMGSGPLGDMVFCVGFGGGKFRMRQAMLDFAVALGSSVQDWAMVDALPGATWPMRIGGFLSCRLGLKPIGRPLVALGAWLGYWRFVAIARQSALDGKPTPT